MKAKSAAPSMDMTHGSPFKLILTFSLPLFIGSALQQMYNMVDSMVVGQFVGNTALAAVGLAFPVVFLLSSLFMGLGSGAMVMISQYFGAGEYEEMRKTIDTIYTALVVGGIPLTLLGVAITGPALDILQTPADAREEAFIYMVILMAGLLGSLGYNCNAGILQGVGDSKSPLLFLVIATVINIGLDLFLVLVFDMGVAGVAIATIAAQFFSWIFGIFYINWKYPEMRIRPFNFRFSKAHFSRIMRLGIPAGIQQALFSFGVIMMTRLVNQFGSAFAAGYQSANKLDTFAFLPIQSLSTTLVTYTGQNIGAGRQDRVRQGLKVSTIMCLIFSVLGLLVIPAGPTLMRLFSSDAEVISAGMAFLNRIMPFYWMLGILFMLNSVMRGAGEAMVPMLSSVIGLWLARVPAAYILANLFGRDNLNFCYVFGWAVSMAITIPYFLSGRWKTKSITRAGNNPPPKDSPQPD